MRVLVLTAGRRFLRRGGRGRRGQEAGRALKIDVAHGRCLTELEEAR
jgi:hypothetical protein